MFYVCKIEQNYLAEGKDLVFYVNHGEFDSAPW